MKKTVISVIGKDAVGITAKVSAACGEHNVNNPVGFAGYVCNGNAYRYICH